MEPISKQDVLQTLKIKQSIYGIYSYTTKGLKFYQTGLPGLLFIVPDYCNEDEVGDGTWVQLKGVDFTKEHIFVEKLYHKWIFSTNDICLGFVREIGTDKKGKPFIIVEYVPGLESKVMFPADVLEDFDISVGDLCAIKIISASNPRQLKILSVVDKTGKSKDKQSKSANSTKSMEYNIEYEHKMPETIAEDTIQVVYPLNVELAKTLGCESSDIALIRKEIAESYRIAYQSDGIVFDNKTKAKEKSGVIASEIIHSSFVLQNGKRGQYGAPVFVGLRNDQYAEGHWYVEFAGLKAKSLNKVFRTHVYIDSSRDFLQELAEIALPEKWTYAPVSQHPFYILSSYFHFTYYNAWFRNMIVESSAGNLKVFNTGLVNYNYRPIYCLLGLTANVCPGAKTSKKWAFKGFAVSGEGPLGKEITKWFPNSQLPTRIEYFKSLNDLFLNPQAEINTDFSHILIDNISRLPAEIFINAATRAYMADVERIVNDMENRDKKISGQGYKQMKEYLQENDGFLRAVCAMLSDAVEVARNRASWNYKTAVPVYYPAKDCISLLLPLNLTHIYDHSQAAARPDVALVVSKQPSGNYQAETIFTLDMSYLDARLVTRPDSDWLNVEAISSVSEESDA